MSACVRDESEPVQIVEQSGFILRAAADTIMIFDPEQHTSAKRARNTPRVNRVDDVSQVKKPSRRRREARHGWSGEQGRGRSEIWTEHSLN